MPAVTYDLPIEQGATFTVSFEWREDDGSNPPTGPLRNTAPYDAYMQIRNKPGGALVMEFNSTTEGSLTVSGGIISLRIGATDTNQLVKQGVYDIELHNRTDVEDVVRLVQGKVLISLQVTEDD